MIQAEKREKSCGAVLFHQTEAGHQYLILLCKGHVEGCETEEETARREIAEETGLTRLSFLKGFREVIQYSPRPGVWKDVVFFLAETAETAVQCQECEVQEIVFLPYQEAAARLTHLSDRETLEKAELFLQQNRGQQGCPSQN